MCQPIFSSVQMSVQRVLLSACLALLAQFSQAAVVTWTDGASNGDWQDAGNWNVHVPQTGDAVILDNSSYNVVLHADAARIRSLYVSDSIALYNFGNKLPVGNNTNNATTTITGNNSGIVVSDIPGTAPAFDTDILKIQNGGYLRMDGGRAQVDQEIDMVNDAEIRGHGLLEVGGGGANAIAFSPTSELRPTNGNLRINMTGGGTIHFGGADIIVTDDNSDLIIDGELSGPIADSLEIGNGNRVDFQGDWEVTGSLHFQSGGGEIVGGDGTIDGTLSVTGGGPADMNTDLAFTASSTTNVSSFNTLELARVSAAAGHVTTLDTASTLRINIPVGGAQSVSWGGHIDANSANFEVNGSGVGGQSGIFVLNGSMDVGGTAFWGPTDLQGTATIYQNGTLNVTGPGGRIHGGGMRFQNGSPTTIFFGADLEAHSLVRVDKGAALNGAGDLVVVEGGLLFAEDDAIVDVDVVNHGTVQVGSIFDNSAQLEFADDYAQTSTGTLKIDLAGHFTSQYDRLIVGNDGVLDGMLDVSLRGGFVPSLGDDFLVLTTSDGLTGTFANTDLPALNTGLTWDLDYSPFAVTLSVVEDPYAADVNHDNIINGADFLVMQRNYGLPGPNPGDATGDGIVTGADFDRWEEQFGTSQLGAVAAISSVPEPNTLILTILFGGLLSVSRSRNC